MIKQKQTYEIVCIGGTLEIDEATYKALMAGKVFRNPSWYPECFISYDKDKDLWYTDKIPEGASAKDPRVYHEIKVLRTQSQYVKPLSNKERMVWEEAKALMVQSNALLEKAKMLMKGIK